MPAAALRALGAAALALAAACAASPPPDAAPTAPRPAPLPPGPSGACVLEGDGPAGTCATRLYDGAGKPFLELSAAFHARIELAARAEQPTRVRARLDSPAWVAEGLLELRELRFAAARELAIVPGHARVKLGTTLSVEAVEAGGRLRALVETPFVAPRTFPLAVGCGDLALSASRLPGVREPGRSEPASQVWLRDELVRWHLAPAGPPFLEARGATLPARVLERREGRARLALGLDPFFGDGTLLVDGWVDERALSPDPTSSDSDSHCGLDRSDRCPDGKTGRDVRVRVEATPDEAPHPDRSLVLAAGVALIVDRAAPRASALIAVTLVDEGVTPLSGARLWIPRDALVSTCPGSDDGCPCAESPAF